MKKLLAILMVLGLAASVGCGKGDKDKNGDKDNKNGDDKKQSMVLESSEIA